MLRCCVKKRLGRDRGNTRREGRESTGVWAGPLVEGGVRSGMEAQEADWPPTRFPWTWAWRRVCNEGPGRHAAREDASQKKLAPAPRPCCSQMIIVTVWVSVPTIFVSRTALPVHTQYAHCPSHPIA